jgi:uncharacterized BrkB/YihY/UPF0761 family membrane protein
LYGAVGQSALMATRKLLSMNDFIGMSLAYRFSPNRKMSRTEQLLFGAFVAICSPPSVKLRHI